MACQLLSLLLSTDEGWSSFQESYINWVNDVIALLVLTLVSGQINIKLMGEIIHFGKGGGLYA